MATAAVSGTVVAVLAVLLYLRGRPRRVGRNRLFEFWEAEAGPAAPDREETMGFLTRWLFLAGFRSPSAPAVFLGLTAFAIVIGLLAVYLISATGLQRLALRGVASLPGVAGDIFLPPLYVGPWIILGILAFLPWVIVRRARRRRVAQVEEDLPVILELLSTLSEAGLGFDSALQRILSAEPAYRPLPVELRTFQLEVLAGRPRISCLRRLARRVDVVPLSAFISALVQAEQIGAGLAPVLRRQADDLRDRRRENALARAMTLPVKLLFPLVICFLPGIFVITLGPVFHQFFQFAEGLIHSRGALP